jgi:hypothetical protein
MNQQPLHRGLREHVVEKLILTFGLARSLLPNVQFSDPKQFAHVILLWAALTIPLAVLAAWGGADLIVSTLGIKGSAADVATWALTTLVALPTLFFLWFRLPAMYLRWRMRGAYDTVEKAILAYAVTPAEFDEAYRRALSRDVEWIAFGLKRKLKAGCPSW